MPTTKDLASRLLIAMGKEDGSTPSPEVLDFLSGQLAVTLEECFGQPALPETGQTSVVTFDIPKTAALFFDRVWSASSGEKNLEGIIFSGGTELEIWIGALAAALNARHDGFNADSFKIFLDSPIFDALMKSDEDDDLPGMERALAIALEQSHGIPVLPMFSSSTAQQKAYAMGDRRTLVASIRNLNIIDEEQLSWDQVVQIRTDKEAIAKLRRLRHWVDSSMEGKPISYVTDSVGARLDDYEWSIKKHGIKTVFGSMQSLLDPKFISATTALGTVVGLGFGHEWGIGVGSLTILGKTVCSIGEELLDLTDARRTECAEVAFVHDIKNFRTL